VGWGCAIIYTDLRLAGITDGTRQPHRGAIFVALEHIFENLKKQREAKLEMRQYMAYTCVRNGRIELDDLPFSDNVEVKVFVVPKVRLSEMSFTRIRKLTRSAKGNLSDDIDRERDGR